MVNIPIWPFIMIVFLVWCIGFMCGIWNDKHIIKDREDRLESYRNFLMNGKIPSIATDSSGRRIYRCKGCNKRVYKTLRHCPSCGQRINWNFIISQEKKEEK